MGRIAGAVAVGVVAALAVGFWSAPTAAAAVSPAARLAAEYSPIVVLKRQHKPCDAKGEPYRPVAVTTVLGRSDVVLRGPDGFRKKAPRAADLDGKGADYYLDMPGNPLQPGCGYERWFDRISAGAPTTAYAHVRAEHGQIALQYWLYYVFNDFNNKHESDWEMVQLNFTASSVVQALEREPTEIGYSQHQGAERAAWNDPKLSRVGKHPLVFPGRGSHANYFRAAVWLGHSAEEGLGCDVTTGPSRELKPRVVLLPDAPVTAGSSFAWLGYQGHWGQRASGPNTGPTGPNMKLQWAQPTTWAQTEWRASSFPIPATHIVGPTATGFFCDAVATGSRLYLAVLRDPIVWLPALGALAFLALALGRSTRWSPAEIEPLARRRSAGQIFRVAGRVYRRDLRLFLAVGLAFVPFGLVAAGLQWLVFTSTPLGSLDSVVKSDRLLRAIGGLGVAGTISTLVPAVVVSAAVACTVARLVDHEQPTAVGVYRSLWSRRRPLGSATLRMVIVVAVLGTTVVGIPFAVVYLIRRSMTIQACVFEARDARGSLVRSRDLVEGRTLRVFAISAVATAVGLATGPILGVALLFLVSASLSAINLVSAIVYVVVMPYVYIALALLFLDLRLDRNVPAAAGALPGPSALTSET